MDPFDRFLRRTLDDVLVSQGVLTREKADEFIASANAAGEPFSTVVLEAATMTPWDLARTVATTYQMPVQPLGGYRFDKDLFAGFRPEMLHRWQVVPLGIFGQTRTFAVSEPPCRGLLDELQAVCGSSLFFFVSEATEIHRALREHVKVVDPSSDSRWQKLFDSAEEEVAKGLTKAGKATRG